MISEKGREAGANKGGREREKKKKYEMGDRLKEGKEARIKEEEREKKENTG